MCGHYREDVRTRIPDSTRLARGSKRTAIHLELSNPRGTSLARRARVSPLRESWFAELPFRHRSLATPTFEQEARRPREPLLPPPVPPKGRVRLSPHGGDGSGRFLATSSVPVSPESISARTWFARRESRPAEAQGRRALREEPPSCHGPRYLSPWQAGSFEASSRPSPHAAPPTLPPDDSAFGTGLCELALASMQTDEHLLFRHRRLVWTTKRTTPNRARLAPAPRVNERPVFE